jgi:hypothetical protein
MNIFEYGICSSIALINFFCLYIKYILWRNGHKVIWYLEWGKDYNRFKQLIDQEQDNGIRNKYKGILNGLRFSGVLLVLNGILGAIFT